MSGCVRMAVRGIMTVIGRSQAVEPGGDAHGLLRWYAGRQLLERVHVCGDDVLRVRYAISCCLSQRTGWKVGATAAVRGCSGRCVVDGETAAARECFEQVRVEVRVSTAVRGCAAGACGQERHPESRPMSRVEVAAERGSIDRTTDRGIQTRLGCYRNMHIKINLVPRSKARRRSRGPVARTLSE